MSGTWKKDMCANAMDCRKTSSSQVIRSPQERNLLQFHPFVGLEETTVVTSTPRFRRVVTDRSGIIAPKILRSVTSRELSALSSTEEAVEEEIKAETTAEEEGTTGGQEETVGGKEDTTGGEEGRKKLLRGLLRGRKRKGRHRRMASWGGGEVRDWGPGKNRRASCDGGSAREGRNEEGDCDNNDEKSGDVEVKEVARRVIEVDKLLNSMAF